MDALLADLRYAGRLLRKTPGVVLIAVLSLALGIGANATIFTWVRSVLIRPFPGVASTDGLVHAFTKTASGTLITCSALDFRDLREGNGVFTDLAAQSMLPVNLQVGDRVERIWSQLVSHNFFDVLGVRPIVGRTFLPEEATFAGNPAVAIISERLRQRLFGSGGSVIDRVLTINGRPFTIVGVVPPDFGGGMVGLSFDLWLPMTAQPQVWGMDFLEAREARWLELIGRLRPDVTLAQANDAMATLARRLAETYPDTNEGQSAVVVRPADHPWGGMTILKPLVVGLAAVVGVVLLLTCANVTNLLLGQAAGRRREIVLRLALGAGGGRIVRQMLVESSLLALTGGALGILLALYSGNLMSIVSPPTELPASLVLDVDLQVVAFTFGVSVLAGLLVGLAPALHARRQDLVSALKEETGALTGGARQGRLRSAFVVAQVSLSLVLLVAAGLLLRSLARSQAIDPGFDPDGVVVASLDIRSKGLDDEEAVLFYHRLLEELRSLPGVESATTSFYVPLGFSGGMSTTISVDGYVPAPDEEMGVNFNVVGPRYFETLRIPLVAGRELDADDPDALEMVVNETMARRYWPDGVALGREVVADDQRFTVVGVAKDGKYRGLGEAPTPFFYLTLRHGVTGFTNLQVRTSMEETAMIQALRRKVSAFDSDLALFDAMPLSDYIKAALFAQTTGAKFLGLFGALALLLAGTGLYGVVSFAVTQRQREVGLRMALGADRRSVLRMILVDGLRLCGIGLVLGWLAAFAITPALEGLLLGVSSRDTLVYVSVGLVLLAVGVVSCLVPGLRASRVDPLVALRYE